MAAAGTGPLTITDDGTPRDSSRMNFQRMHIISLERNFVMQHKNDPKHTAKKTKGFIRGKEIESV